MCAVGAFVDKDGHERRNANWNQEALAALDPAKVDALSLHLYGGPQTGSLTESEKKLGRAFKSWQDFWVAGMKRSRLPEKFDLWITEFNMDDEFGQNDNLPESKGTWGDGLGNIYSLHYWLKNEPRVKVVLLHEQARVIVEDGPDIKAHGRAYGLFARAALGRTRARALDIKGAASLRGSSNGTKGIIGWKFDTPDSSRTASYALVNFSGSPQSLSGLQRLAGTQSGQYIQASTSLGSLKDPGEKSGRISALPRNTLDLPAYSVTLIEEPLLK